MNIPPIGGADLECLLSCNFLNNEGVSKLIIFCKEHDFTIHDSACLLLYGDDLIEPIQTVYNNEIINFLGDNQSNTFKVYKLKFIGKMHDVEVELVLTLYMELNVISLSTIEDFLWNFSDSTLQAKFERLNAFGKLCSDISILLSPLYAYIGSESFHADELQVDEAEKTGVSRYHDNFFSEGELLELYNWYLNIYTKRWER